jgi:hypothetical protein
MPYSLFHQLAVQIATPCSQRPQAVCIWSSRIFLCRAVGLLIGTIVTCNVIPVVRISGQRVYRTPYRRQQVFAKGQ